jgi:putative DNA primase/helicase
MQIETVRKAEKVFSITGDIYDNMAGPLVDFDGLPDEIVKRLDGTKPKPGRKAKFDLDDVIKNGRYDLFRNDRSRAVWWVINEMIRRGKPNAEIEAALLDKANRISDHVYDQKQGAGKFVQRQIERAREVTGEGNGGLEDSVALEFSAKYADSVRYVAAWNRWYIWDDACWKQEKTRFVYDLARPLCRKADDAKAKTVNAVVSLASADRRQAATIEQWDANPWLLGTPQGTVNLRTGKLLPPKATDYITKSTSVAPSDKADCPLWFGHLEKVTRGDKELQGYLKRCAGYCLTGDISEHSLFFLFGTGRNGKGVFVNALANIWQDYHEAASMDMFIVTRGERHPTDLAQLRGARLVTSVETEAGRRWDEAKLKFMTGGDQIPARFMRQDFFKYLPQFKLMIQGNHKPSIRSVDEAVKARMGLTPFTVTIPPKERDKNFGEKLKPEYPGILRWAIEGCLEWQQVGLQPPKAVIDATAGYMMAQDTLQAFLDECCEVAKHEHDTITHIYDGYVDWAEACHEFIWTKRDLSERLENHSAGFTPDRFGKDRTRGFVGLRCIRENARKVMAEAKRRREEMEEERRREEAARRAASGRMPE